MKPGESGGLDRFIEELVWRIAGGREQTAHRLMNRLSEVVEADGVAGLFDISGGPSAGTDRDESERWDHQLIAQHVSEGASVLDLGCGSGTLLAHLMEIKNIRAQGVELDADGVMDCVTNGVPVFQDDLDGGLAWFPDHSFDYVVLEETVQTLNHPEIVIREMARVGSRGIITFPNFGHWKVRLSLAINGRMPVTESLPYQWYDSPNIHSVTLDDLSTLLEAEGITICEGHVHTEKEVRPLEEDDNLFGEEIMLMIRKNEE